MSTIHRDRGAPPGSYRAGAEEDLPVATARGSPPAFGALYDRHVSTVYRYLYGQTGSRETAEDLTSVTFTRALAAFPRFQPAQPFVPWLLRIAHNTLIDHRRASMRAARLLARLASMRTEHAYTGPDGDARDSFLALTGDLPKAQRDALALRFLVDLDVEEIAGVLGRSSGATRMLLMRALRTLRARAEREGSL